MKRLNRRCTTQAPKESEIPPLKLPDINILGLPIKHIKSAECLHLLKSTPLSQNQDFLKEKAYYRFAISRKPNQISFNKSETLITANSQFSRCEQSQKNQDTNREEQTKQLSVTSKAEQGKRRYFRRKNVNELQMSLTQSYGKEIKMLSTQFITNQQRSDEISEEGKSNVAVKLAPWQIEGGTETKQLSFLKREMDQLREENRSLKEQISQKCKEIQLLESQLHYIKKETNRNLQITDQSLKCNFFNEQITHQLIQRDFFIRQLQSKLKYIELENITLRKVKAEKTRQDNLIAKLENKTKMLEERVKILTKINAKQNILKASMISSQCSEISLNLSADEEEIGLLFQALTSNQQNPQRNMGKTKNMQKKTQ